MIVLAIYCGLSVQHFVRIRSDLTLLLYDVQGFTFFRTQCIRILVQLSVRNVCGHTDSLHRHLERLHIEYLQFAFRWMNNILMREMPLRCVVRLWDTYLVYLPLTDLCCFAILFHRG